MMPTMEAFQVSPDEWDQQFDRYLKERFKPFRDKERPADYGRDLAPDPRKGQLLERAVDRAVALGRPHRRHDRQRPRPRVRHRPDLGEGRLGGAQPHRVASTRAWDSSTWPRPGGRWNSVPWMSWSPTRRSHCLLRAHRKGPLADRAERGLEEDRGPHCADHGRRARVARLLARRQAGGVLGHAAAARPTSSRSTSRPRKSST